MEVELGRLRLKNPVLVASGCFGYGREYATFFDLSLLGGITVKAVTRHPWPGNPPPRLAETPGGLLNSIGLENPGVEAFVEKELPWLRQFDTAIIVNVAGKSEEEYVEVSRILSEVGGVEAIELNLSCPNVAGAGLAFGADPQTAYRLVRRVREATSSFLVAKLSPQVADLEGVARAVEEAGAEAISAVNTFPGLAIDADRTRPVLSTVFGGLSGPAIKPLALGAVWRIKGAVRCPVIGMGGVSSGRDAAEFILAGASAVAVGTALFVDPLAPVRVLRELQEFMEARGWESVSGMVGKAREAVGGGGRAH